MISTNKDSQATPEPEELRRFLLGLDPAAEPAFEERLFDEDDELFQLLEQEQRELAQDFVAGHLSRIEATAFRRRCARSAVLRDMVDEARALTTALERRRRAATSGSAMRGHPRAAIAVAAAVLCVLLALVWVYQRGRQSSVAIAARPASPAVSLQTSAAREPVPLKVTFFLSDINARGASHVPALTLAPAASQIVLQLELRGAEKSGGHWKLTILHEKKTVWVAEDVNEEVIGKETFLQVQVPASALPDGAYAVRLEPLTTSSHGPNPERLFVVKRER